jgi:hypothetical protein
VNVSWSDLNNVQDAGEYPFRDGIISVIYAEILIWKQKPDTQFQLMRKHPIHGQIRYVLGRPVEERQPSPIDDELIYESSNGDSWFLSRNPASSARAVMHRPNLRSGGQVSYVAVDQFLREGANGPEHQALRRLMETRRVTPQPD